MNRNLRILFALAHFAAAAFCIFGFLASFEPVEHAFIWRSGYALVFVAAVVGGIWWIRR